MCKTQFQVQKLAIGRDLSHIIVSKEKAFESDAKLFPAHGQIQVQSPETGPWEECHLSVTLSFYSGVINSSVKLSMGNTYNSFTFLL